MRFRLRTLLILLAVGPLVLAGGWWTRQKIVEHYRRRELQLGKQQADFDDLIRLIQETVKPESWDDVGGPGSIDRFSDSLTIITGPGQTVHEQPTTDE
jgi:hypothetical protein